jgi:hypothetical protein
MEATQESLVFTEEPTGIQLRRSSCVSRGSIESVNDLLRRRGVVP